jgi:hypothetical protein
MKRLILGVMLFTSGFLYAQNEPILRSSKGTYILPQSGDWGLGTSARPFLEYFGTLFSGNNTAPNLDFHQVNQGLFVKKFTDEKTAIRLGLFLNNVSGSSKLVVQDLTPGSPSDATVTDVKSTNQMGGTLLMGLEKRRGAGRLQGIYGYEGFVGYSSGAVETIVYGNSMEYYANAISASRVVKNPSSAPVFNLGAQAFIGFEYFFAPKFSIGGEFNIRLLYAINSATSKQEEVWDANTSQSVIESERLQDRSTSIGIQTLSQQAGLRLHFYF